MEGKLENVLDSMMQNDNVVGALIADSQGLAYGSRGIAKTGASGIVTAIAEQAAKIHPNSDAPVVILESDNTSVTISKFGFYTGAIYKKTKK